MAGRAYIGLAAYGATLHSPPKILIGWAKMQLAPSITGRYIWRFQPARTDGKGGLYKLAADHELLLPASVIITIIMLSSLIIAALRSRCGHYIFAL